MKLSTQYLQCFNLSCRPVQVQLSAARPRLAGVHLQLLPRREDAPAQERAGDRRHEQEAAQRQGAHVQLGQGRRHHGRRLSLRRLAVWLVLIHSV